MWINEFNRWFAVILEHYGSLDKFTDARTIRIMLQGAEREITHITPVVDALKAVNDSSYDEWLHDLNKVIAAKNHLSQWLSNRGLEP